MVLDFNLVHHLSFSLKLMMPKITNERFTHVIHVHTYAHCKRSIYNYIELCEKVHFPLQSNPAKDQCLGNYIEPSVSRALIKGIKVQAKNLTFNINVNSISLQTNGRRILG